MSEKDNIRIGQLLVLEEVISLQQLEVGLREQKKTGSPICTVLVSLGFASEDKIFNVLSKKLNIPYIKLKDKEIDRQVIQKVPVKFASHYKIIPVEFKDDVLTVAVADPLDIRVMDDIRLLLGYEVKGVLASEMNITEAIKKYYGVGAATLETMVANKSVAKEAEAVDYSNVESLESLAEDASIIKFVNQILQEAVKERATDIHLEPFHNELRTRFRIDGMLYNINIPDTIKYFQPAIVSRIKIMSALNIAEHRLPQDGRIKIKVNEQEIDLRVSVIPTIFGESVQIRVLSQGSFLELDNLGFCEKDLKIIAGIITKPHGVIFVTGPTGSGKSTTLYAILAKINSNAVKIITIEDPVEYQLRGVNQIQVNPNIGFTFATALRSMLRHDPDVMMVGEVRDFETAEIAIRSALTGHLVFSTLHTNDAAGAVTRLLDMGVEPFLVSSSLECLIAQRLVRLICPDCKKPAELSKDMIQQVSKCLGADISKATLYEGKGCEKCRFTGYRGRTGIYEILVVTDKIREMILSHSSSQQILHQAMQDGMRTLRYDGLEKVLKGITTYTEVIRVTQQEASP